LGQRVTHKPVDNKGYDSSFTATSPLPSLTADPAEV
jgi:hypothetical protein